MLLSQSTTTIAFHKSPLVLEEFQLQLPAIVSQRRVPPVHGNLATVEPREPAIAGGGGSDPVLSKRRLP